MRDSSARCDSDLCSEPAFRLLRADRFKLINQLLVRFSQLQELLLSYRQLALRSPGRWSFTACSVIVIWRLLR